VLRSIFVCKVSDSGMRKVNVPDDRHSKSSTESGESENGAWVGGFASRRHRTIILSWKYSIRLLS
jgi:hypothetical protein